VTGRDGRKVRVLLLTQDQAEQFWRLPMGSEDSVLLSSADVFASNDGVHLRSVDPLRIAASFFNSNAQKDTTQALWSQRGGDVVPRQIEFEWNNSRLASLRPPIQMDSHVKYRDHPMPLAPQDSEFSSAAAWTLQIPTQSMNGLSDIYLRIRYAGDVARLSMDGHLLDDDFYNGRAWEIGLKRFLPEDFGKKLEVSVLPLPSKAPIYLDERAWEPMNAEGQTAKILGV
jgi:beta-galactosidase